MATSVRQEIGSCRVWCAGFSSSDDSTSRETTATRRRSLDHLSQELSLRQLWPSTKVSRLPACARGRAMRQSHHCHPSALPTFERIRRKAATGKLRIIAVPSRGHPSSHTARVQWAAGKQQGQALLMHRACSTQWRQCDVAVLCKAMRLARARYRQCWFQCASMPA